MKLKTRSRVLPGTVLRVGESYTIYQQTFPDALPTVTSSKDIHDFLRAENYFPFLESKEIIYAILMNRRHRIIAVEKLGEGAATGVVGDLKQLYQAAIINKAQAVALSHNHPSGTLYPSEQDKAFTKKIANALKLLDVSLLDHVIITSTSYYSFADEGLI